MAATAVAVPAFTHLRTIGGRFHEQSFSYIDTNQRVVDMSLAFRVKGTMVATSSSVLIINLVPQDMDRLKMAIDETIRDKVVQQWAANPVRLVIKWNAPIPAEECGQGEHDDTDRSFHTTIEVGDPQRAVSYQTAVAVLYKSFDNDRETGQYFLRVDSELAPEFWFQAVLTVSDE